MPERIVVKENELEQMIVILRRSSAQLREVQGEMHAIAQKMEGGALIGVGGTEFVNGLNNNLSNSIEALAAKLEERAAYVQRELEQNQAARNQSRGRFV
ncbi:MAG: hypothetical protein KC615_01765 [Anaerolineae bacterium]|nr:hypothetical protein [Anaerolineae bacterium]MCA9891677.1 hypothetical protein [Anaerolineae bacterium]